MSFGYFLTRCIFLKIVLFHAGDIANSSNAFMGNCSSINPCDVGNGICRSDIECGHGLKCGKRNCPVMIEDEVEVVANCCYKPNDGLYIFHFSIPYQ